MATETQIIQCPCGASIRVPTARGNRQLRCPACQAGLALTTAAQPLAVHTVEPGEAAKLCQVCQSSIAPGETLVVCPQCEQSQHQECWAEVGGCGTYGCAEAPNPDKTAASVQAPLSAWGDTKRCPACGETIKSIALKCRYCDTEFGTVDPISLKDLRKKAKDDAQLAGVRQSTIAIFVVSLIGCFAPLMVLIAPAYLLPKWNDVRRAGPQFVVMSYAAMILSGLLTFLLIVFLAFGR